MAPTQATLNREALAKIMSRHVPTTVHFRYENSDGEVAQREAEPYEIKNDKLYAYCLLREETRQFRLDKMSEIAEGRTFKPRHAIKIPL